MAGGVKINDRQMKQAMRKMGMKQTSVEGVTEVVIRTRDKEIVITDAEVICVEMSGTKSYQVAGVESERMLGADGAPAGPTFPEEDITLVMSQAGCDRDTALSALQAADGQLAEAIIKAISG